MDKNTVLQIAALGATAVLAVVVKIFVPQPTNIFGFTTQEPNPIIKMPDSVEVAKEKTAAIKELLNSEAFKDALPSAQKQMLDSVKAIYN